MEKILFATVNQDWVQFEDTLDGTPRFVLDVPEFNSIIEKESENGNFFVDYVGYVALGKKNYPLRPTRVFLKDGEEIEPDSNCVTSPYGELDQMISAHLNQRSLYFLGSPEFSKDVIPHVTQIKICMGEGDGVLNNPRRFPYESAMEYFHGRMDTTPNMLESINRLKELGGLDENDRLFKCPMKYTFVNYTRGVGGNQGDIDTSIIEPIINFIKYNQAPTPLTPLFHSESLNISGSLSKFNVMELHNHQLVLVVNEIHTRYSRGKNFENDRGDIVSQTEHKQNFHDFRFRYVNGAVEFAKMEELQKLLTGISLTHLGNDKIWNIEL